MAATRDADSGEELALVRRQEEVLVFDGFGEDTAFALGSAIRSSAWASQAPLVIDIRLWDRALFFAALPGSCASHANMARRKSNVVRMFGKSSYRMALEQGREDRLLPPGYGLATGEYVLAGGAFPVRVQGVGIIGAITVSGLTEREDHRIVVAAITRHPNVPGNPASA